MKRKTLLFGFLGLTVCLILGGPLKEWSSGQAPMAAVSKIGKYSISAAAGANAVLDTETGEVWVLMYTDNTDVIAVGGAQVKSGWQWEACGPPPRSQRRATR